ncbi:M14 family metallopeptidase [Kiloniella sp. b19]|uniref:M14 family metallopeptidase n=1 Tax=Kiloniella sp. GXU_MW_B19 TaxID=3141326 RepID=UPI0031DD3B1F
MLRISSAFDAGNIRCLKLDDASDIVCEIEKDSNSDFYQWFYFRLSGAAGQNCTVRITNAAGAAYPNGWENYNTVASYDREHWFRVPTRYENGELIFSLQPEQDSVYFAYFAPYSMERHADLIAACQSSDRVSAEVIGQSLDGQDIDLLKISDPETPGADKLKLWVLARQHPGESMTEFWIEGFLDRLLDEDDPVAREILKRADFYVIPNMNPDGSRRGNLRVNAAGANLNREWENPTLERSPEVFYARRKMMEVGVDFSFDIHGDEGLPYNFIAGTHGIPSFDERLLNLLETFKEDYERANPDFQRVYGYPQNRPQQGNLTMCSNNTAETHNCLAMTLEMPFKDNADAPNELEGWSPSRSQALGYAAMDPIWRILDKLR